MSKFSLILDYGNNDPALPSGHPFTGVAGIHYWSSTTGAWGSASKWIVLINIGHVRYDYMGDDYFVWPVRGGN